MAFIALRRSRNTKSYYLVESYRDEDGRSRKHTLCYLGRESDGTDTLARSLSFWEDVRDKSGMELSTARGRRSLVLVRRHEAARVKIGILKIHLAKMKEAESRREEARRRAREGVYWQAFDRLRWSPSEENARTAKKAFITLAKVYHPDHGGTHEAFLRLKDAYDQSQERWNKRAA